MMYDSHTYDVMFGEPAGGQENEPFYYDEHANDFRVCAALLADGRWYDVKPGSFLRLSGIFRFDEDTAVPGATRIEGNRAALLAWRLLPDTRGWPVTARTGRGRWRQGIAVVTADEDQR